MMKDSGYPAVMRVMICVAMFASTGGTCFARRKTIAEMTGLAPAQVSRALARLVADGYLSREKNGRRTEYRVVHNAADHVPKRVTDSSPIAGKQVTDSSPKRGERVTDSSRLYKRPDLKEAGRAPDDLAVGRATSLELSRRVAFVLQTAPSTAASWLESTAPEYRAKIEAAFAAGERPSAAFLHRYLGVRKSA